MHTHVEGDPGFKCNAYYEEKMYSNCLRKLHTDKIMDLIGCMPPWMVSNKSIWCDSTVSISDGKNLQNIL